MQEEDEEVTDETITTTTTEEIRKAIDTLVEFSMYTQSGKIGTIALKAAKLFEKELCESMKQTVISDFFEKKLLFDTAILYRILYVLIDLKYEMCVRCLKCIFFIISLSRTFSKSLIY